MQVSLPWVMTTVWCRVGQLPTSLPPHSCHLLRYDDDNNNNNNSNNNNNNSSNNNCIERRNSRFLQSPHCSANCLQHVHSNGPGAIVCKSRATSSTYRMQPAVFHLVQRDS